MKLLFESIKIFKAEKIKYTIILSIFLVVCLSATILVPITFGRSLTYRIVGVSFFGILDIFAITMIILLNVIVKSFKIEFYEDKILIYKNGKVKEVYLDDVTNIKLAQHYVFGQFVKINKDLYPLYLIESKNDDCVIPLSEDNLKKIHNKDFKKKINKLYTDSFNHKSFNRIELKNKYKFFK